MSVVFEVVWAVKIGSDYRNSVSQLFNKLVANSLYLLFERSQNYELATQKVASTDSVL